MPTQLDVDIAIVGGAMTGVTLALALRQRCPQLSVALIERAPLAPSTEPCESQVQSGFDARVIALNLHTQRRLERDSIWPALQHQGCAIETIHVSDQGHGGMVSLNPQCGQRQHGWVMALSDVQKALVPMLAERGVRCFAPATICQMQAIEQGHQLQLADGTLLTTRLLVGADGTQSQVAQHLGLQNQVLDLQQSAIIANIACQLPHHGCAFERFTAQGPVALLPMQSSAETLAVGGQGQMSLVWCLPPEQAMTFQQLPENEFLQALQHAFGWRLGRFLKVGTRHSYPLNRHHQPLLVGHHGVLVGNAAQTLHPIAGQGFNLGLRDVDTLVDVIAKHHAIFGSNALGSTAQLADYAARRAPDRQQLLSGTVGLLQLFRQTSWPMVLGRQLGLMLASHCAPLRQHIQQLGQGIKAGPQEEQQ